MKDFTEEEMPGWKTPMMRQGQDQGHFVSGWKIHKNLDEVRRRLRPTDSFLDVGCYRGHLSNWFRHPNYTGVDIFPEHIEQARTTYPQAKFECKDLFDLDGSWDVVLCCRVLMHVPNFEKAVRKLISIAKRQCILIIPIRDRDELRFEPSEKVYFRVFSKRTVQSIAPCEVIAHGKYSTVIYG